MLVFGSLTRPRLSLWAKRKPVCFLSDLMQDDDSIHMADPMDRLNGPVQAILDL